MSNEREILIKTFDESNASTDVDQSVIVYTLPVSKANAIAQGYLSLIRDCSDSDDFGARKNLHELINSFVKQEQHSGDADDFHNFAVELARNDEYSLACLVLECGLSLFPKNVDLISDYLQYGVNCNKTEECKKYYKTLIKIPRRRWTWRGFAFLVDYLKFLIERSDSEKEIDAKEQEMISIVSDFRNFFQYSEESYRVEADVYKNLNMQDKELETLETALKVINVAPKCALRCADILFERGRYEEASQAIKRVLSDATQSQSSVNEGYIYYLSALCKIAVLQKNEKELDREHVEDIYSDFNIALSKFKDTRSYADVIKTKTNTLINKSGIEVDNRFDLLSACISY